MPKNKVNNNLLLKPGGGVVNGPDGLLATAVNPFGDASDGDVTISSNTSLSRDMYYGDLTVNNGIILNPNGYKIYVRGDLNTIGTGKIASNGLSTGAPAYTTGTLPIPIAGGSGGGGGYHALGGVGGNGANIVKSLNTAAGAAGGVGGGNTFGNNPTHVTIAAGVGGTVTGTIITKPYAFLTYDKLYDIIAGVISVFQISPGAGGGSGGDGYSGTNQLGGNGGVGGSSGGFVWIFAYNIVNLNVEAKGGNGGAGGAPGDGYGGGGGGGGGGNGGCIMVMYFTKTTITSSVVGGAGGIANTAGSGGMTNGSAGNAGLYKEIAV